jgi:hypothetical protein
MYTEAEAKTKWCPYGRAVVSRDNPAGLAAGANVGLNGEPITPCIASACMAWRWVKGATEEKPGHGYVSVSIGYCGAFGNPKAGAV